MALMTYWKIQFLSAMITFKILKVNICHLELKVFGMVQGFWNGSLSGVFLGVLLDSTIIQKYKEETILCPDGTLVVLSGYKAREIFKEGQFCYVERGNTINLKLE